MIKRYKKNEIEKLVKILKNDGVISVPTDTVFGICARINSERAHDKLITIKNRSIKKSFPVMCANEEQIKNIAIVNDVAKKLIKSFMPGPITLVLKKNKDLPEYVTNGKDTIAIRMATSETTKKLILELGSPIFMTSANQSGEPTCTSLDEIEKEPYFNRRIIKDVYDKGGSLLSLTSYSYPMLNEVPSDKKKMMSKKY